MPNMNEEQLPNQTVLQRIKAEGMFSVLLGYRYHTIPLLIIVTYIVMIYLCLGNWQEGLGYFSSGMITIGVLIFTLAEELMLQRMKKKCSREFDLDLLIDLKKVFKYHGTCKCRWIKQKGCIKRIAKSHIFYKLGSGIVLGGLVLAGCFQPLYHKPAHTMGVCMFGVGFLLMFFCDLLFYFHCKEYDKRHYKTFDENITKIKKYDGAQKRKLIEGGTDGLERPPPIMPTLAEEPSPTSAAGDGAVEAPGESAEKPSPTSAAGDGDVEAPGESAEEPSPTSAAGDGDVEAPVESAEEPSPTSAAGDGDVEAPGVSAEELSPTSAGGDGDVDAPGESAEEPSPTSAAGDGAVEATGEATEEPEPSPTSAAGDGAVEGTGEAAEEPLPTSVAGDGVVEAEEQSAKEPSSTSAAGDGDVEAQLERSAKEPSSTSAAGDGDVEAQLEQSESPTAQLIDRVCVDFQILFAFVAFVSGIVFLSAHRDSISEWECGKLDYLRDINLTVCPGRSENEWHNGTVYPNYYPCKSRTLWQPEDPGWKYYQDSVWSEIVMFAAFALYPLTYLWFLDVKKTKPHWFPQSGSTSDVDDDDDGAQEEPLIEGGTDGYVKPPPNMPSHGDNNDAGDGLGIELQEMPKLAEEPSPTSAAGDGDVEAQEGLAEEPSHTGASDGLSEQEPLLSSSEAV